MKVMSPGSASRMPATPRIIVVPSPRNSPPSSSASSDSVRVITSVYRAAYRAGGEVGEHGRGEVEALVGVDDEAARRVEHEIELAVAGDALHRGADLGDDVLGGALVLLRGLALRAPDVLDELLVVADRALE